METEEVLVHIHKARQARTCRRAEAHPALTNEMIVHIATMYECLHV